jgi:DNA-binding transcriptional LysR family regulator
MIVEKLIADELVLIVPAHHPWAKKKEVSISELTKEPFIFREGGSGTRQMIEKFLANHGIAPQDLKISMVLGSTEAIKEAVENGLGVSIVSRWAARKENRYGTLSLLKIKEQKMMRDFSLITNKSAVSSHAVDEFLTYLKAYPFSKLLP